MTDTKDDKVLMNFFPSDQKKMPNLCIGALFKGVEKWITKIRPSLFIAFFLCPSQEAQYRQLGAPKSFLDTVPVTVTRYGAAAVSRVLLAWPTSPTSKSTVERWPCPFRPKGKGCLCLALLPVTTKKCPKSILMYTCGCAENSSLIVIRMHDIRSENCREDYLK